MKRWSRSRLCTCPNVDRRKPLFLLILLPLCPIRIQWVRRRFHLKNSKNAWLNCLNTEWSKNPNSQKSKSFKRNLTSQIETPNYKKHSTVNRQSKSSRSKSGKNAKPPKKAAHSNIPTILKAHPKKATTLLKTQSNSKKQILRLKDQSSNSVKNPLQVIF